MPPPVPFVPAGLAAGRRPARRQPRGFALVVTLIILSLLVVIAVSFLTSMSNERQTADAYTAQARADQAAQAGVDAATSILTQAFRDFPDSATVWDPYQTVNTNAPGGSEARTTVTSPFNEGTSLYLHAASQTQTVNGSPGVVVADPAPNGASAANDVKGNNPNNPACKTFVLPLISGVPGGYARLVSEAASSASASKSGGSLLPAFDLAETNPALQTKSTKTDYCTDLNVRRYAGDLQGIIGSPADWASGATRPLGPKPARALWINLKDADDLTLPAGRQRVTGRYAFWIEDESFRANISNLGSTTDPTRTLGQARVDNTAQPQTSGQPRALTLADLSLPGFLNAIKDGAPSDDATALLKTRAVYPDGLFPEPMAFAHSTVSNEGSPAFTSSLIDAVRYSSTTQSGTLNFTRQGTQRLNLNGLYGTGLVNLPASRDAIQSAVDQIVETLKFHLPNFGQRFYRTSFGTDSTTLNAKQVVANSPGSDHATIYLYKVAANICDYIDTDSQPTMILGPGDPKGRPAGAVDTTPITVGTGPLDDEAQTNRYWAQGKEASPFIQEVVVRYRSVVGTKDSKSPIPERDFDLQMDYYIELWNMTDRDIYAAPQSNPKLPHLNGASLFVRDQQPWTGATTTYSGGIINAAPGDIFTRTTLPSNQIDGPPDWQIDLSSSSVKGYDASKNAVPQDGSNGKPQGVVFRAGVVTIITTDPDCFRDRKYPSYSYKFISPYYLAQSTVPDNYSTVANPTNVFYCPLLAGQREYTGHIQKPGAEDSQGAMMPYGGTGTNGGYNSHNIYSGTEVSLGNKYGYLDIVRGAVTKVPVRAGTPVIFNNTFKFIDPTSSNRLYNYFNDFSFGGALMGNVAEASPAPDSINGINATATASELGDPRTNNEQLAINIQSATSNTADGSHYMPGRRSLGTPNGLTVRPNLPVTTSNGSAQLAWGDYFSMPDGEPSSNAATTNANYSTAPAIINDNPLTSIGQLGDVYDPARLPRDADIANVPSSRGGGRTFKIGQHDDRYSLDPSGNPADGGSSNNTPDNVPASNGWASWRLADVFSIDGNQEKPGRINLNGVRRDNGAALMALLDGWNFQPTTASNALVDWSIHGDGHTASSLAGQPLTTTDDQHGTAQLISSIVNRLNNVSPNGTAAPSGPFFERGEFSELIDANKQPLFGTNSANAVSTALVGGVDMNKTFDHSREETFRRLSELICTRGDTFTAYVVGQSIFQAPVTDPNNPPPMKVTGTHRMRVTFRLVPKGPDGYTFAPKDFVGTNLQANPISAQVAARFAKPDHYAAQVLEVNTY